MQKVITTTKRKTKYKPLKRKPSIESGQCTCKHCGFEHKIIIAAYTCCLFVPEKHIGWCAWCGEDSDKTFCKISCANQHREEIFSQYKKLKNN